MRIEYVLTRSQRDVADHVGQALIARKVARRVYETRAMVAEPAADVEISPRTGKPKRQYKRRDMSAE